MCKPLQSSRTALCLGIFLILGGGGSNIVSVRKKGNKQAIIPKLPIFAVVVYLQEIGKIIIQLNF